MKLLTVNFIYGFGWMRGGDIEQVPPPCEIQVEYCTSSVIVGKVFEVGHPYMSCWLVLGRRTSSPDGGTFNVYVYECEPLIVEDKLDQTINKPVVTGFCRLGRESKEPG